MISKRVKYLSNQGKLWELYLHTLAGMHGNTGANGRSAKDIAYTALAHAQDSLDVWEAEHSVVS